MVIYLGKRNGNDTNKHEVISRYERNVNLAS